MLRAGIINVTGYAGVEIARILARHPEAEISTVTGRSSAGKKMGEIFPHLSELDLTITEDLTESVDVLFSALPHAAGAIKLTSMLDDGVKVIDVSADFRLKNSSEYKEWYGIDHPCPEYLDEAVYGLTELNRNMVSSARLVANPGCYPTASILALAPAIQAGIVKPDIVVDAKSGVSGAGRGKYPFADTNENLMAYSVAGHRHMPEIKQELNNLDDSVDLNITFLTHLVPMNRGILVSCYAPINDEKVSGSEINGQIRAIYEDFYGRELFVEVSDFPPMTKNTLGTNKCLVFPSLDLRSGRLIVVSCIDNLIKGAAGQAIQNMNLMFNLPEDMGLNGLALYP